MRDMANFDDIDAKKAFQARASTDRLAKLGQEWFAEAREKSAREDADVGLWKRRRKKTDTSSDGFFDLFGGDSGDSGDGGSD